MILAFINKGVGNYGMGGTPVSASDFMVFGGGTTGVANETDPTVASHIKNITTTQIANWNAAYGWGNHSGLYRSSSWLPNWTDVQNKPVFTRTVTGLVPFPGGSGTVRFLREDGNWAEPPSSGGGGAETDPTVPGHVKSITTTDISNWTSAYNWGNHANMGYATTTFTDGRYSRVIQSVMNLNTIAVPNNMPQFFVSGYQPTGRPGNGANYQSGIQFKHSIMPEDYRTQLLTDTAAGNANLFIRTMINGTWGAFARFWTDADVPNPMNALTAVKKVWTGTQYDYDMLAKSADTIYFVT
jgi:hypothetical protein